MNHLSLSICSSLMIVTRSLHTPFSPFICMLSLSHSNSQSISHKFHHDDDLVAKLLDEFGLCDLARSQIMIVVGLVIATRVSCALESVCKLIESLCCFWRRWHGDSLSIHSSQHPTRWGEGLRVQEQGISTHTHLSLVRSAQPGWDCGGSVPNAPLVERRRRPWPDLLEYRLR